MCVCRSPGVWDDLWIWAHWPCPQWCRLQVVMVAHHLWVTVVAVICVHAQLLHNLFTSLYTLFDSTTINWYGYRSAIYVGSKLSIFWKKWVFFPNQACFRCYLWLSITCVCCERSISKLMSCTVFLNSFLPSCLATCRCVGARIVKEVLQFIFESGFPHDINAIMEHNFFQEVDLQQPPHYEDVVSSLSTVMWWVLLPRPGVHPA